MSLTTLIQRHNSYSNNLITLKSWSNHKRHKQARHSPICHSLLAVRFRDQKLSARGQINDDRPRLDLYGRLGFDQGEWRDLHSQHVRHAQVSFQHAQGGARHWLSRVQHGKRVQRHLHDGRRRSDVQEEVRRRQGRVRAEAAAVSGDSGQLGWLWDVGDCVQW